MWLCSPQEDAAEATHKEEEKETLKTIWLIQVVLF